LFALHRRVSHYVFPISHGLVPICS
jgi:hypothetical protein